MDYTVFLSYASKDRQVAVAVCAALESRGIRCWMDRDIRPGEPWEESIIEAISACKVVLLIFSGYANDSPEVRREVERAASTGKIILPFRIEDVMPSRALEYWIGDRRWLDAVTPPLEQHMPELWDAISRLIRDAGLLGPIVGSGRFGAGPSTPPMPMPLSSKSVPGSAAPRPMPPAAPVPPRSPSPVAPGASKSTQTFGAAPTSPMPSPQSAPPRPMPPAGSGGKPGWLTGWWKTLRSKPSTPSPTAASTPGQRESTQHELTRVSSPRTKIDPGVGSVPEVYRCSAFYPERIEATTAGRIVVSIHLESVSPDVVREAARRLDLPAGDRIKAGSAIPAVRLPRHGVVDITMEVPGLAFETMQASLHLWEDQQFVEFRFKPEPSSAGQLCRGWVHFWFEGIVLADVAVAIMVEREEVPDLFRNALAESNARPYRFVFPSYSHQDKEAVERMESYAESFGDTYLRDVRSLRAGQEWNEELRRFIKRANVFQLFWSENAAQSTYVESEWKCALTERNARPDPYFVRPIYWTDKPAAIPVELSHIHFAKVPLIRG